MRQTIQTCRERGYVETILGRQRKIPDIEARDRQVREFAERTAINTPVQGSAADMIKLAMIAIDRRLREEKFAARMLLQVHDELVFEVPVEEARAAGRDGGRRDAARVAALGADCRRNGRRGELARGAFVTFFSEALAF